jgi:hypothetical protein
MDYFILVGHICTRDKDDEMSFKIHKNHLMSSSCVCFMATFASLILFCNVNNSFTGSINCKYILNS